MRVEIWADVVCPWCYIGKRRFAAALEGFAHREQVEVVYRSYELDPFAPAEGTETTLAVLARKFNADDAGTREMMGRVDDLARAEGLEFDYEHALHARTLTAHRLIHLARAEGGASAQDAIVEELMAAYFTRGASLGERQVLRDAAAAVGLDAGRVEQVLQSEEFLDDVLADVAQARAYGSSGVPFYVVDGRYGISGAQPTELFAQALEQAWETREG